MDNTFFTSDPHYGHSNIIKFCNRPFKSVKEMNDSLVDNWNKKVGKKDLTYIIGDLSWGKPEETGEILESLNGDKVLIIGNHDSNKLVEYLRDKWIVLDAKFYHEINIKVDNKTEKLILMHYPIEEWRSCHHGSIHLHGHTHNNLSNEGLLRIDVGVDAQNFSPISLREVFDIVNEKKINISLPEKGKPKHNWDDRVSELNELYRLADNDHGEFMNEYLKYKNFYEAHSGKHIS